MAIHRCPFNNLRCFYTCEFFSDKVLKTRGGKITQCTLSVAASVISELDPEAINALYKEEDKKE